VANSDYIARELRAVGVCAPRLAVIPNAPFERSVSPPAARTRDLRRVVYVGQIIPEKGVLPLLDAIGLLVARGHDVRLDIAGEIDGWAPAEVAEYRQAVRSRAAAHDLAGRVRFLGWRDDVETVLAEAGLHCCPSQPEQREGFGNVVVEAKRAGVPSVVCPSGALPEMVEHLRDGWVASGFDATAIAEGLEWFLVDDARWRAASHEARRSSRRYDPQVFAREWQALFGVGEAGLEPRVPWTIETRA
jgi:glycosyltransferase involved in cell wall biosynthesis